MSKLQQTARRHGLGPRPARVSTNPSPAVATVVIVIKLSQLMKRFGDPAFKALNTFHGVNTLKSSDVLTEKSAKIFCKGPDSKYVLLCGQDSPCHKYLALPVW